MNLNLGEDVVCPIDGMEFCNSGVRLNAEKKTRQLKLMASGFGFGFPVLKSKTLPSITNITQTVWAARQA